MITTYQVHSHSKSCQKYKNQDCRYNFGKHFTDRAIVPVPLSSDMPEITKNQILAKRDFILSTVKPYIDENLNPKKQNLFHQNRENFEIIPETPESLNKLNIKENKYYEALSISVDTDFQTHLRRMPNSRFINNYFAKGLEVWRANIDIHPVFNNHKAVQCMCAYFSKAEDETSEALKQAAREAFILGKSDFTKMKTIAKAYILK